MHVQEHVIEVDEYTDEEEVIDCLVNTGQLLGELLERKQPKYLEDEIRKALASILLLVARSTEGVHVH